MTEDPEMLDEVKDHIEATLLYVTKPDEKRLNGIEEFIRNKYGVSNVVIQTKEDRSLKGGFILRVENEEYDWSNRGRLRQLRSLLEKLENDVTAENKPKDIVSIFREQIDDFELKAESREIGFVRRVGDGVATVEGIDHAFYGEVVLFDNGIKGMVMSIERKRMGVMLFGDEDDISEGMKVARTMSEAGIEVGDNLPGRVINALGDPIDGKGRIEKMGFRPIENPAPAIIERHPVNTPMETGILAIDSMFPIGRGQRELIIGDRQTGKTSIAIDTIINH